MLGLAPGDHKASALERKAARAFRICCSLSNQAFETPQFLFQNASARLHPAKPVLTRLIIETTFRPPSPERSIVRWRGRSVGLVFVGPSPVEKLHSSCRLGPTQCAHGTLPMFSMLDSWTVKSPRGVEIIFKIKGSAESGFEHSACAEGRKPAMVRKWQPLIREEVERLFSE